MRRAAGALRGAWAILARQEERAAPLVTRFLSQVASVNRSPLVRPALLFSRRDARDFADKAKEDLPPLPPPVKMPKLLSGVHGNYAASLYVTAVRAEATDQVDSEMRAIAAAVAQSPEFQAFAEDIFMKREDRIETVKKVFGDSNLHTITMNFLTILAEDGQFKLFPRIAKSFAEVMDAHRGRIRTLITTADEPSSSDLDYIKKNVVDTMLEPGQTAIIETKINEDIIGGCIVEVGDKLVDMSIGKRIVQIEKVLLESLSQMDA
ncbi:ATP synthase subunit O, mitochondrial [Selaginella moellendorffii]|uniref:ATP synthase subunit O, mitochondrial n=1 Tax=Selaginella moellendorffii TaxID=88036 RepID=UPI000D1C215E|nr:ATP synthase subunit O, mitochondrial [Selaginella moellendorffii]|eukprot:XP_024544473.1 ATP synthase subunit O, mitochondrial [Selaginella moellendorffii]